jgi:FMN phosphatase YigB (HAD superfamily)
MVSFNKIKHKLAKKRLFIFDFDETIVNLNLNWRKLKQELTNIVKIQYGIEMTFTPILEKLEYLRTQISASDYSSIDNLLKQEELNALHIYSTIQSNGMNILEQIYKYFVEKSSSFIAILSNNYTETIKQGAKLYNIDGYIATYVGRDMVSKIKPDTEGMEIIHNQFPDVKKEEMVYFGDSEIYDKKVATEYQIDFILIEHPSN